MSDTKKFQYFFSKCGSKGYEAQRTKKSSESHKNKVRKRNV